jgi:hypothetical protein
MAKPAKKQMSFRLDESTIEFLQKQAGILDISVTEVVQQIIDAYKDGLHLENQTTPHGYYSLALEKQLFNLYNRQQISNCVSTEEVIAAPEFRVCFRYVKSKSGMIKPQEYERFEERVWQIAERLANGRGGDKVKYEDLVKAKGLDTGIISQSQIQAGDKPGDLESRLRALAI